MRRRTKYKQTLLSTLFIEGFFLLLGKAVEPVPLAQILINIVTEAI